MGSTTEHRRTALYAAHRDLGAKLIPFAGFELPAFYQSLNAEHEAVREAVGVFDVSHMGEIRVKGKDAEAFLSYLSINDVKKLKAGEGQYTAILNENGGMLDDLILYRLAEDEFFICTNASNDKADFSWFSKHSKGFSLALSHESDLYCQLAVQGPESPSLLKKIFGPSIESLEYMQIRPLSFAGEKVLLARTGYTGEKGYEIYLSPTKALEFWSELFNKGKSFGLKAVGLGARDTLRLEANYLLYGQDMDESTSPLEAGIGWAIRKTTDPFIGSEATKALRIKGLERKLVAFTMTERSIPRHGMRIFRDGSEIGQVRSGSYLPSLAKAGGLAMVSKEYASQGTELEIDIRGHKKKAIVEPKPLFNPRVK